MNAAARPKARPSLVRTTGPGSRDSRIYLVLALSNEAQSETGSICAEEAAAKRYQLSAKLHARNDPELTRFECTLAAGVDRGPSMTLC